MRVGVKTQHVTDSLGFDRSAFIMKISVQLLYGSEVKSVNGTQIDAEKS